jgi:hypothetical protein
MSGVVPPLFLYVFVACIETSLVLIGGYKESVCFIKRFTTVIYSSHRIYSQMSSGAYLIRITFREVARLVNTIYCPSFRLY